MLWFVVATFIIAWVVGFLTGLAFSEPKMDGGQTQSGGSPQRPTVYRQQDLERPKTW